MPGPAPFPLELPFIVKALLAATDEDDEDEEEDAAAAAAAATAAAATDVATVDEDSIPVPPPLAGAMTPPSPPRVLEYVSNSDISAPAPRCEAP